MSPLNQNTKFLTAYEIYVPTSTPLVERLFKVIFTVILAVFIGIGFYFKTIEPVQQEITERIKRIRTQFLIQEKKKVEEVKKPEKKKKKKKKEKPVDLTKKPELNKKIDDIKKTVPKKKKVPTATLR